MKKILFVIIFLIGLFCFINSADAATFITPVEITPGSAGSWQDANVSSHIPAGATGAVLHIVNKVSVSHSVGFRKNGSSDNRVNIFKNQMHIWVAIGVDNSRILELYLENTTNIDVFLVGYFTSDAVFFTNAVDKSLSSTYSWTDIDISSDTGGDTAIGAMFDVIITDESTENFGFRKNGSSDSYLDSVYSHTAVIIGVDGSEICEGKIYNAVVDFFLVGYITSNSTFNTNATDISLGSAGSWLDLSALPSGAIGGFIEVKGSYDFGFRKNGSAEDIYRDARHSWGIVECDANRIIEGKVENSAFCKFYLVGYLTAAAGGTDMQINIGDAWKDVDSMKINISDSWKDVAGAKINIGDAWKTIY